MAMDRRCVVETLAEFGFTGPAVSPRMRCCGETDVLTCCTGHDEVSVYSKKERRVKASE